MYLTYELLEKYGACDEGLAWFKRRFPQGGELMEVMSHPKVSNAFLHWGFTNLPTSQEEKIFYREKTCIDCGEKTNTVYESDHVLNSEYVTRSSNITDSRYVFCCENVSNSKNITGSENIEQSERIYNSSFCFDSQKILYCKNITESATIIHSNYVLKSSNIINGSAITNSHYVSAFQYGGARNIADSWFISESSNLKGCLFCSGLTDAEYYLFNKPIEKIHYDNILAQMNRLFPTLKDLELVDVWPEEQIPLDMPRINRNVIKQYSHFPAKFWQWVKTLPGYDPQVLYSITYQPNII